MHVDAALPLNDWCNTTPVGHTKDIAVSSINPTILVADKVKTHRINSLQHTSAGDPSVGGLCRQTGGGGIYSM